MNFILATTILIIVYVASNLLTIAIRTTSTLMMVMVFVYFLLHITMNVFNIFGAGLLFNLLLTYYHEFLICFVLQRFDISSSVWLFSAPGKYYVSDTMSPLGCDSRIVDGLKIYLISFWSYFVLLLLMVIINMCCHSYKELVDEETHSDSKLLHNQWIVRNSRIQNY